MQIRLSKDGILAVRKFSDGDNRELKKMPFMHYSKADKTYECKVSADALDRIREMLAATGRSLPSSIEAERQRLHRVRRAVDAERVKKHPLPLVDFPVREEMYEHQVRAANMALLTYGVVSPEAGLGGSAVADANSREGGGFGLLFEMGCGKTLTAIAVAGALFEAKKIERVLVISPASVVNVWTREIARSAEFPAECAELIGTKAQRLKNLEKLESSSGRRLKVAVVNYEAIWRDELNDALLDYGAEMVICDESQRIKAHDSKQSRAAWKLGDGSAYRMILSGTPIQNNAIDLWSQYRFLDPAIFGESFYAFRARYAIMGGFNRKEIIGYRNMSEFTKKEHSIALRVTKLEALDLPEKTFETRVVEFSAKERGLYEKLRSESYVALEDGGEVTAQTALTKLLRLQQLAGGFLAEDNGGTPKLVSRSKLNALEDIIRDYVIDGGKKIVVFARFVAEVEAIQALADRTLPESLKAVSLYGAVKKESRGEIVDRFQNDPDTVIIIGQIDTAGTGITLTAADTAIYYSKTFNYASYEQSMSRIHRIGQRNTCTYIDLETKGTVDQKISKALSKKKNLASEIVDNWRELFEA